MFGGRVLTLCCSASSILGLTFVALTLAGPGWARAQSAAEGQKLYTTYCSSCHGDKGRGDGAAGKALPVKPADHTDGKLMNSFSDEFLINIISKGGAAVGKSSFMPGLGWRFERESAAGFTCLLEEHRESAKGIR